MFLENFDLEGFDPERLESFLEGFDVEGFDPSELESFLEDLWKPSGSDEPDGVVDGD